MIDVVMPTYARTPVSFERGEGAHLYATDGRRFLDFGSGIAVSLLGHSHPALVKAITDQANALWHTSNLYQIPNQQALADRLVEHTFADTVFFTNSGTEACELAVKMARKYWYEKGAPEKTDIITFEGSFHGRSSAGIAAAGSEKMTKGFGPILPGFDIDIEELAIENLTLAPGIAGDGPQRVDVAGSVQVADRRLMVDLDGELGQSDRLNLLVNAEPDGDDFDLALDVVAAADGPIATLAGLENSYTARLRGDGTWSRWTGGLLVRGEDERIAALRITNRAGLFGLSGRFDPSSFVTGIPARALGDDVAIKSEIAIDDRVFDGRALLRGAGLDLTAEGLLDLAQNRAEALEIAARVRDPSLLGEDMSLRDARLTATIDGAFDDLAIVHDLRVAETDLAGTVLTGLRQQGTADYDGTRWTLPLNLAVARIVSGNALVDPRLVDGRGSGTLVLSGSTLLADDLRLAFANASANLALRGDLARGAYLIRGPVRAQGLALDNVGTAGGTAVIDFALQPGRPWRLGAELDARVTPVTNATLANLAGPAIRVRGGIATGGDGPLDFDRLRINASKLTMALDGSVRDGTTRVAGSGRHADYGAFTVEASVTETGPTAALVFDQPFTGLENVRVAIAPSEEGFAIDTEGGSVLGPFVGELALLAPSDGPTRITIGQLRVSETDVTGGITLIEGGADGTLAFNGGGLSGTVALAPRGGAQGVTIDLAARNARFGGEPAMRIARADIDASGVIGEGRTAFTGSASAAGLSYGTLFIGRLAAEGALEDGVGRIDASLSGRRSGRFVLDLNAAIAPERIALAAKGQFAGRRITMPRRAVLTSLDGGGWRLAPTQLSYGDGGMIASGSFGGGNLDFDFKLARMPLSLIDVVRADTGLGGTISGAIDYRTSANGLPVSDATVKIEGLTRSGLVLTSRPVNVALVARLTEDELATRAILGNSDIQRGRVQARITGLPRQGVLIDRLRAGRLAAQLRYRGAAESLWRLAALDTFDITGDTSAGIEVVEETADGPVHIDPSIFRSYDIRGIVGQTLNAEGVYEIGRALGSEAAARGQIEHGRVNIQRIKPLVTCQHCGCQRRCELAKTLPVFSLQWAGFKYLRWRLGA